MVDSFTSNLCILLGSTWVGTPALKRAGIWAVIFQQIISSEQYVIVILGHFLRVLWKKERHCYFMQDGTIVHAGNSSNNP
jgi:hypothetical protein